MVDDVPFERDGNISRRSGVEAWDNPHSPEAMYASIWKFEGDPDRLAPATAGFSPEHPPPPAPPAFSAGRPPPQPRLALRAPDGLVVVDTCPTRDDFVAFTSDPSVHAGLERHG